MTDLDRLDQLRAARPWYATDEKTQVSDATHKAVAFHIRPYTNDAELIVAAVNALPDLTARVRELEAREAKVRELIADSDRTVDYFAQESGVAVPRTVGTADLLAILDCKGE